MNLDDVRLDDARVEAFFEITWVRVITVFLLMATGTPIGFIAVGCLGWYWWGNNSLIEKGKRFVRAHEFLMYLELGESIEEANRLAEFTFSKYSDPDMDRRSIERAKAYAKFSHNGKQLPVIGLAQKKGFKG